jgi:hypothetical protein
MRYRSRLHPHLGARHATRLPTHLAPRLTSEPLLPMSGVPTRRGRRAVHGA